MLPNIGIGYQKMIDRGKYATLALRKKESLPLLKTFNKKIPSKKWAKLGILRAGSRMKSPRLKSRRKKNNTNRIIFFSFVFQ